MLFSKEQPPEGIRPALDALRRQDEGTLAMTDEGLVDLNDTGPGAGASDKLDADEIGIEQAMQAMHAQAASIETPPAYNAVTTSAWRMLEEQRYRALDLVREYDAEIEKWTAKRDDAQRAADGCEAGQQAMETTP